MKRRSGWLKLPWCVLTILTACWEANAPGQTPVKMWRDGLTVPTYHTGAPEKNPIFYSGRRYQGAKGPVYPYPLLDKLSDVSTDKTYDAVYLENRYVQFSVLPQLGGRIFSGLDKTDRYDFIYRQHVIKPALIGMLGAWISGGVEWNIPHHHRASSFMPVDCTLVANPDGSKTVWVGETERRHRMKWLVGLTLYPDRSYLEATVKLFNRSPLPHSLLYFANVAVHANDQYQVIFPPNTEFGTQHGKSEFVHWPIGQETYGGLDRRGVDLSWWKNHPTPISIFAWNYEDDFFGGYDHGREAGIVHLSDHHAAPGKKFFEFANGSEGRMWDKILTDADGPYLELMAGAYSDNQPDYSWIQPYEVKIVKQYWYPIRQLGGIKSANLDAAVNLDVDPSGKVRLALNTTAEFRDAKVVLQAGAKSLFTQVISISPEKPFVQQIALPPGVRAEDLKATLFSAAGKELISYQPVKPKGAAKPQPVVPPPPPKDVKTNEELYLAGQRLEQFHSPALEPYPYYEEAIRRDPGDSRANTALGVLYLKRGMFRQAEERFNVAIARLTHNYTSPKGGEAFYYLGVAMQAQGKYEAADDAFHRAAWSHAWYAASHHALAEDACRRGQFAEALELIDRALSTDALSTKALDLRAMLLRKLGRLGEPIEAASRVRAIDPLDFWARNEFHLAQTAAGKPDDAKKTLADLNTLMRGDVQSYLELAIDYGNCGLWQEAVDVLDHYVAAAEDKKQVYPMVHYHLGFYLEQKGDQERAAEHYRLAAQMPTDYCFPFRLESIAVLERAMERDPKDARAPYYLGNLLYDLQPEKAVAAWEQSRSLDDKFATVHRNLGLAYARVEKDNAKAVVSLEKAVSCDSSDPKLYAELDAVYEATGVDHAKRLAMLEAHQQTVTQRDDALLREITLLVLVGQYDRANDMLDNHHFHLWEGESGIHDVYVDAHLLRGQQHFQAKRYADALKDYLACLEYPERFETGRPYRRGGRMSQIDYFLGTAYEALGEAEQAKIRFQQAAAGRPDWSESRYYQALAYQKLGDAAKAAEIFDGLIRTGTERLQARSDVEFFAKFGARQSVAVQTAQAHYLVGLGYLGKQQPAEAKRHFAEAVKLNLNHLGARTMLANVQ